MYSEIYNNNTEYRNKLREEITTFFENSFVLKQPIPTLTEEERINFHRNEFVNLYGLTWTQYGSDRRTAWYEIARANKSRYWPDLT